MRIAILQPGYLPWIGMFAQMATSDAFVILDNVQYDKHSWRNRNCIKTAQGVQWLTVPVLTKGRGKPLINDVLIDNATDWRGSHWKSIKQNYSKALFFDKYSHIFETVYDLSWALLSGLDVAIISELREALGIQTKVTLASDLRTREEDRVRRLIAICQEFGADEFIEGDAGKDYLEGEGEAAFDKAGIQLIYHNYQHPVYKQLYGEFVPYLSAIDLLFNCGPDSLDILTHKKEATRA